MKKQEGYWDADTLRKVLPAPSGSHAAPGTTGERRTTLEALVNPSLSGCGEPPPGTS